MGPEAEGIEGTVNSYDPETGFEAAFTARFNRPLPSYAAATHDAVLLLAYGLERSGGVGGESLARAMGEVVDGTGHTTGWDPAGVKDALGANRSGNLPNVSGGTGGLAYSPDLRTELSSSTYGHWKVSGGKFVFQEFISTSPDAHEGSLSAESLFRTLASESKRDNGTATGASAAYDPGPRAGLWALIVAGLAGWENYRHQADALAFYQLLRSRGVADDRIVLAMADDIAGSPRNPEPGIVRNYPGGPNLHEGANIDYRTSSLSESDLSAILNGESTTSLPHVISAGRQDNVLLFMVGHGGRAGFYMGVHSAGDSVQEGEATVLDSAELAGMLGSLSASGRFRRLLIVVEACHAGALGAEIKTPGVLLITGANATENSQASNYDVKLNQFLADDFAWELFRLGSDSPSLSLDEAHRIAYVRVKASHVSAYNEDRFGDMATVTLAEFISP